jgi:hypothetical protein
MLPVPKIAGSGLRAEEAWVCPAWGAGTYIRENQTRKVSTSNMKRNMNESDIRHEVHT